jgi:hypothetical protein
MSSLRFKLPAPEVRCVCVNYARLAFVAEDNGVLSFGFNDLLVLELGTSCGMDDFFLN